MHANKILSLPSSKSLKHADSLCLIRDLQVQGKMIKNVKIRHHPRKRVSLGAWTHCQKELQQLFNPVPSQAQRYLIETALKHQRQKVYPPDGHGADKKNVFHGILLQSVFILSDSQGWVMCRSGNKFSSSSCLFERQVSKRKL